MGDRRLHVPAADDGERDGRRGIAGHRRGDRGAWRLGLPEPRGPLDPVRGPGADLRRDRRAPRREGDPTHAGALRGADQRGADRPSRRGDQGGRRHELRLAHAAARGEVRADRARGRPRHPRDPGHGGLGRARLDPARAAQPEEVHPRVRYPGDRRRLRVVLDGPAPDAHRRGRRARGGRSRQRVHDARCARGRACPRPRRSPTPRRLAASTSTRPAGTAT